MSWEKVIALFFIIVNLTWIISLILVLTHLGEDRYCCRLWDDEKEIYKNIGCCKNVEQSDYECFECTGESFSSVHRYHVSWFWFAVVYTLCAFGIGVIGCIPCYCTTSHSSNPIITERTSLFIVSIVET